MRTRFSRRFAVRCQRLVPLLCVLLMGASTVYRWVDESGAVHFGDVPPRVMKPLVAPGPEAAAAAAAPETASPIERVASYIRYRTGNPAQPEFQFAVAITLANPDADGVLEADFENPSAPGSTVSGAWIGKHEGRTLLLSPPLEGLQCRSYDVTVRWYSYGQPVAVKQAKISSGFDSGAIAAAGANAIGRMEQGQLVCLPTAR